MTGFVEGKIYQKYSAKTLDIQNYINYNIIIADIIQQKILDKISRKEGNR